MCCADEEDREWQTAANAFAASKGSTPNNETKCQHFQMTNPIPRLVRSTANALNNTPMGEGKNGEASEAFDTATRSWSAFIQTH
jgi:hypothetical protein